MVGIWGSTGRFDCFSGIANEEGADLGQGLGAHGVGEEAEMANAMEARGQDMEEEAADELIDAQAQGFVAFARFGAIILPLEGDVVFIASTESAVGDRDAVGVAREVGEHCLGAGEGALGVDDPIDLA